MSPDAMWVGAAVASREAKAAALGSLVEGGERNRVFAILVPNMSLCRRLFLHTKTMPTSGSPCPASRHANMPAACTRHRKSA